MQKKKWSILCFFALIWVVLGYLGMPLYEYLYYKVFNWSNYTITYYLVLLGLPFFNFLIGNILSMISLSSINSKNLRGISVATAAFTISMIEMLVIINTIVTAIIYYGIK